MKFKKVYVNGKEYYEQVNDDEIIDEEVKNEESDNSKDKHTETTYTYTKKFDKDFGDSLEKSIGGMMGDIGNIINSAFNTANEKIKKRKSDDSVNPNSKTAKLLSLLPFMDDDDIHDLFEEIMNDEEMRKEINLVAIFPFLDDDDCDELFIRSLKDETEDYDITKILPFVSDDCLSDVVDDYVNGNYPNLDVDKLYPYLESSDVKKIFYYVLRSKKEPVEKSEEEDSKVS